MLSRLVSLHSCTCASWASVWRCTAYLEWVERVLLGAKMRLAAACTAAGTVVSDHAYALSSFGQACSTCSARMQSIGTEADKHLCTSLQTDMA